MQTLRVAIAALIVLTAGCAVEVADEPVQATGQALSYTTTWPGIGSSAFNKDALQCIASAYRQGPVTCTMTGGTIYDRQLDCREDTPSYPTGIRWQSRLSGTTSNPHNANGRYASSTAYLASGLLPFSTAWYWTQAPEYVAVTNNTILHRFGYSGSVTGGCNITRNETSHQITCQCNVTF